LRRAVSTLRNYQGPLRSFLDHLTDERYPWVALCQEHFGQRPVQIVFDDNAIRNVSGFEGDPARRPFPREELIVSSAAAMSGCASCVAAAERARWRRCATPSRLRRSTPTGCAARSSSAWTSATWAKTRPSRVRALRDTARPSRQGLARQRPEATERRDGVRVVDRGPRAVAAQADVSVGEGEHRLGLAERVEIEGRLANGPGIYREPSD